MCTDARKNPTKELTLVFGFIDKNTEFVVDQYGLFSQYLRNSVFDDQIHNYSFLTMKEWT